MGLGMEMRGMGCLPVISGVIDGVMVNLTCAADGPGKGGQSTLYHLHMYANP